ncbi:sensor histidine kinase [Phyllobacterium sophorae]|uniref:histidine kinase n=1 Tax=Phyllobacterium sophorae TaxID=1520277 RepID=A0A2P7B5V5_9HYPH|nr:ATP-binding protein [Phyllobacterium sophorae]PSH61829.1 PAS domain-containing sensor histidine kinase [Phyllobacterium sophorae]
MVNRRLIERWHAENVHLGNGGLQRRIRLIGAACLVCIIFLIDTFTSLGSAIAVLYVLVLVLAGDFGNRLWTLFWSLVCAALTVASFAYVHGYQGDPQAVLRLLFSLSTNIVTTVLVLRRHADRVILEAQARLLDLTNDAIFLRDRSGKIVFWNRGAQQLYGWSSSEVFGRDAHELLQTRFPGSRDDAEAALIASGHWQGELRVRIKDGREIDVLGRWRLQKDRHGTASTILETNTDISEQKVADRALKVSEHRFRTIFETLAVAIWEHDFRDVKHELDALHRTGVQDIRQYLAQHPEFVQKARRLVRITDVNQTALKLMGVPSKEEFFTHLDEFLPDTDESFAQCLIAIDEGHSTFQSEATVRGRHGKLINVIVVLSFPPNGAGLDRIQGSIVDITERLAIQNTLEQTRRELEQASRAAMIGEISASIAHEVNQPLSAITTSAQAAQRWLAKSPPDIGEAHTALADVVIAAQHADGVVKRVRMLLSKSKTDLGELLLDEVIADTVHLKRAELEAQDIDLSLNLRAVSMVIEGDRILLQQVVSNIVTNAIQAMESVPRDRRSLSIVTEAGDNAVWIRIADSGPGLAPEMAERTFRAFSTTKDTGMGLGLAICRSIVTAHSGSISIVNRDDAEGALVEICLPNTLSPHAADTFEMTA